MGPGTGFQNIHPFTCSAQDTALDGKLQERRNLDRSVHGYTPLLTSNKSQSGPMNVQVDESMNEILNIKYDARFEGKDTGQTQHRSWPDGAFLQMPETPFTKKTDY